MTDWDDAFANGAYIAGSADIVDRWQADAAAFRATAQMTMDVSYGDHPREAYDLVHPAGSSKGLAVFVHGGYWMRTDKSVWTHLAAGAVARGWTVCLPSYTLAPNARLPDITRQIGAAISHASAAIDGPIRLAGHSAGGHLVSRMICADTSLTQGILDRIAHTLSISGLHDLRPLMQTQMNETLGLDLACATRESAALQPPAGTPRVTAWVGGGERPEFIRQAQLLALMWQGLDADIRCHIDGTHDHFSVIEGLREADSGVTSAWLDD